MKSKFWKSLLKIIGVVVLIIFFMYVVYTFKKAGL